MKTTGTFGTLVIAGVLALAAMAPPAYPQRASERDMLNDLTKDVIDLRNSVRALQDSVDQKNNALTTLVQRMSEQFSSLSAGITQLGQAIKTDDEKAGRDLQELRTLVTALKKNADEMNESLTGINNQVGSLSRQLTEMKTTEEPLPSASELWNLAWSDYSSGSYDLAIRGFRDLLTQYPASERAPSALIYVGKSLFAQKKFDQALIEYDQALQNFPTSDKTCSALYEKGLTLIELKKAPDAKATLDRVVKECAGKPEAASASTALKTLASARPAARD